MGNGTTRWLATQTHRKESGSSSQGLTGSLAFISSAVTAGHSEGAGGLGHALSWLLI